MTSNPAHHALFVLSNTLTIVPYIFFLSISKEQTLFAILAFVLYYTFKMTGVFFLQTLPQFSTSALLTISFWIGTVGALFGIFSMVWGSALLPAAALIGLSAAWIPPADLMYRQQAQLQERSLKNDWRWVLIYLVLLLGAIQLNGKWQAVGLFTGYLFLFISAIWQSGKINVRPRGVWQMLKQVTGKQLLAYLLFFGLLFLLRTGRLLKSNTLFEWALFGFMFVFALLMLTVGRRSQFWRMPFYLNVLTFLHGIVGNFLFLFGSVYVGARFGQAALTSHVYIPYAIGLFVSMTFGGFLEKKLGASTIFVHLSGMILCTWLFCFDAMLPIGLAGISFFNGGLNRWLGQRYRVLTAETIENRSLAKYATQSKGSLVHQFLLMGLLFGLIQKTQLPVNAIFRLSSTSGTLHQETIVGVLDPAKWVSAVSIILLFLVAGCYFRNDLKQTPLP
ncbi:hypothetical protein [Enterococcus sp.]|uniref:hypothetical protein n=1 Tax=Enterococcus sp. TaxID=35783 RepID=UPI0028B04393|nr:hypothetical protein [Enterococcus sp.]